MTEHHQSQHNTVQLGLSLLKQYKYRSLVVLVSLLAAGLAEAIGAASLLPLLSAVGNFDKGDNTLTTIIDGLFEALNIPPELAPVLVFIIAIMTVKGIFTFIAMRNVGIAAANMANDLRIRLVRALMNAQWHHFRTLAAGQMANAVGTEADRASHTYIVFSKLIAESLVVMIYLAMVFMISWHISLIAITIGLIVMALLYKFVSMVKEGGREQTRHMADLAGLIADSIGAVKIIKAMGREKYFIRLLRHNTRGVRDAKKIQVIGNQGLRTIREPLFVALIAVGIYLAKTYANMNLASMMTFAFMFLRIVQKATNLQVIYQRFVSNESAYRALMQRIQDAEFERETWKGTALPVLQQALRFKNVSFSHAHTNNENSFTLHDATAEFPACCFNAIIGPSGAGKTTLVDLLLGFYRPNYGQILVDNKPLQETDITAWRQSIGYVPQECPMLHDSIYHNITMGNDDYSADAVQDALEAAGAWPFIKQLPNNIHETVGEEGVRFSGGERQRIAIARALIGHPQLILLDEATSALDRGTEQELLKTVKSLSGQITIIAISHTPIIQDYADHIFYIDQGILQQTKETPL